MSWVQGQERRLQPTVVSQIQEEECGFRPGPDHLFNLVVKLVKRHVSLHNLSTCVLWTWRRPTPRSPGEYCGMYCESWGTGPFDTGYPVAV